MPTGPLDPRQRFTATAALYPKYRPSYPPELYDWIAETVGVRPPARVADIGCGTGIATRQLAERGYDVVGVDPNADMLAQARREAGGPRYVVGTASATGLPDASVDLVTAGQAAHWFPLPDFLAEVARIGRWGCVFWYVRAPSPFNDGYEAALNRYSSEYRDVPRPAPTLARLRELLGERSFMEVKLRSSQVLDEDGVIGRAWSSSYVAHGVADRDAFDAELRRLFAAHRRGDVVEMPYDTLALAWPAHP